MKSLAKKASEADPKALIVFSQGNTIGSYTLTNDDQLFSDGIKNKAYWEDLWNKHVMVVTGSIDHQYVGVHVNGLVSDIAAPVFDLSKAQLDGSVQAEDSGTSFAAPQVTGAAALLFSLNPELSPHQVKQLLIDTAQPSNRAYGILDVNSAMLGVGTTLYDFIGNWQGDVEFRKDGRILLKIWNFIWEKTLFSLLAP